MTRRMREKQETYSDGSALRCVIWLLGLTIAGVGFMYSLGIGIGIGIVGALLVFTAAMDELMATIDTTS